MVDMKTSALGIRRLKVKVTRGRSEICRRDGSISLDLLRLSSVLPRDVMQGRPMPSCGVRPSVRPSVCPSVTLVYSVETNKHIFKIFHLRIATSFWFFRTKHYGSILTGTPLMGALNAGGVGKNRDSRRISGYRIDDCCSANNNCDGGCAVYRTHQWSCLSQPAWTTMTKNREQNIFELYAAVNLKRHLRSTYCTIEATDRHELHEASRGFTAEKAGPFNVSVNVNHQFI